MRQCSRWIRWCVGIGVCLPTLYSVGVGSAVAETPWADKPPRDRGIELMTAGRYAEAEPHLSEAVAKDPKDTTAWYLYAKTLQQTKKFEEAAAAFEQLSKLQLDQLKQSNQRIHELREQLAAGSPASKGGGSSKSGATPPPAAPPREIRAATPEPAKSGPATPARVELPPPPQGDTRLDGIFVPVAEAMGGSTAFYYFRPDGYAYLGLPPAGYDDLDLAAAAARQPERVATYAVRGGQITLTPVRGQPKTLPIIAKGSRAKIGDEVLWKGEAIPADEPLDGTYYGRNDGGGAKQVWSYTFTRAGTFSADLGLGTTVVDPRSGPKGTRDVNGTAFTSGTYRRSGTTLTLTAPGGQTRTATLFVIPDPQAPIYVIEGRLCYRR